MNGQHFQLFSPSEIEWFKKSVNLIWDILDQFRLHIIYTEDKTVYI